MSTNLPPGARLGRYEIKSQIGEGGMGLVYLAHDTGELDRDVAIKVLPVKFASNAEWLRRSELEAKAASTLKHPNILTVYDFGKYSDRQASISHHFRLGLLPSQKRIRSSVSAFAQSLTSPCLLSQTSESLCLRRLL